MTYHIPTSRYKDVHIYMYTHTSIKFLVTIILLWKWIGDKQQRKQRGPLGKLVYQEIMVTWTGWWKQEWEKQTKFNRYFGEESKGISERLDVEEEREKGKKRHCIFHPFGSEETEWLWGWDLKIKKKDVEFGIAKRKATVLEQKKCSLYCLH